MNEGSDQLSKYPCVFFFYEKKSTSVKKKPNNLDSMYEVQVSEGIAVCMPVEI